MTSRQKKPGNRQGSPTANPQFSRYLIECCGGLILAVPQPAAIIWA